MPVNSVAARPNSSTLRSGEREGPPTGPHRARGSPAARTPHIATTTPSAPPAIDVNNVSEITCLASRLRGAPSARHTERSRCRPAARARNRLARLAQPSTSSTATMPSASCTAGRTAPGTPGVRTTTRRVRPIGMPATAFAPASAGRCRGISETRHRGQKPRPASDTPARAAPRARATSTASVPRCRRAAWSHRHGVRPAGRRTPGPSRRRSCTAGRRSRACGRAR